MSLTSQYSFSGNSNDSVGGFNGTNTSISYVTGFKGQGASFNGSSSKIVTSMAVGLNPLTVNFWIKVSSNPSSGTNTCLNYNLSSTGTCKVMDKIYYNNAGGVLKLGVANSNDSVITSFNKDLNDGSWHMVTYTLSANGGTQTIYVDKVSLGTASHGSTDYSTSWAGNTHTIGCDIGGTLQFVNGIIDEMQFYNNALTQTDINNLYASYFSNPNFFMFF